MRAKLVESDLVECVLGLGPNLFYNSPMEACVLVCRMTKPPKRQGSVLFINAVRDVTRERAQSFLREAHIKRIVVAYRDFSGDQSFARVATREEILANDANLSIPLYVPAAGEIAGEGDAARSLPEAITAWQASGQTLRAAMNDLFTRLEEAGFGESGSPAR